jgi:hypothetical protein
MRLSFLLIVRVTLPDMSESSHPLYRPPRRQLQERSAHPLSLGNNYASWLGHLHALQPRTPQEVWLLQALLGTQAHERALCREHSHAATQELVSLQSTFVDIRSRAAAMLPARRCIEIESYGITCIAHGIVPLGLAPSAPSVPSPIASASDFSNEDAAECVWEDVRINVFPEEENEYNSEDDASEHTGDLSPGPLIFEDDEEA